MGPYYHGDVSFVCSYCSIGDWFVLRQISKNIDPQTFSTFVALLRIQYEQAGKEKHVANGRGRSKSTMERLFATEARKTASYGGGGGDRDYPEKEGSKV
jgi:hypothetical protein